jgi:hypothetical protein
MIRAGMKVVDVAGARVGDVTGVGRTAFRIRRLDMEQMWLSEGAFLGLADGQVRLVCGSNRIEQYRVEPPLLPSVNW